MWLHLNYLVVHLNGKVRCAGATNIKSLESSTLTSTGDVMDMGGWEH